MFKKKDLKTGMLVKYKSGELRQVLIGTKHGDLLVAKDVGFNPLSNYDDYLNNHHGNEIVAIYQPISMNRYRSFELEYCELVWSRYGKKMTLADIEEALGHGVEIVE
jgi:hypothetical protein